MTQQAESLEQILSEHSAKILAILVRVFGNQNWSLAEDVLQEASFRALVEWQEQGVPPNPVAWLTKVAKNLALDQIRHRQTQHKYADDLSFLLESQWTRNATLDDQLSDERIRDSQLRLLFTCCHPSIDSSNRLPIMLRYLCGLSIPAIGSALYVLPSTIKKRIERTKAQMQSLPFEMPQEAQLSEALHTVHIALYLLFNEGFHCTDKQMRLDNRLCQHAISLTTLLTQEQNLATVETFSLLALMYFQWARIDSKVDGQGNNVPIDLQDRSRWDQQRISIGGRLLSTAMENRSSEQPLGRFFLEAMIARCHCIARHFSQTNWAEIEQLYRPLCELTDSPVTRLNYAVALGHCGREQDALALVEQLSKEPIFSKSHLPLATQAYLQAKIGQIQSANESVRLAKRMGGSDHEMVILEAQIQRLAAAQ